MSDYPRMRWGALLMGWLAILAIASGVYFGLIHWFGVHHELAGVLSVLPCGVLFAIYAGAIFAWDD